MSKYVIDEKKLVSLYNNGITIKKIAEKLEIPYGAIRKKCKLLGLNTSRKTRIVDDSVFSEYNIENCYWAGFIAADGNISKDCPYMRINLAQKDIGHLKKFKQFCSSDFNIYTKSQIQKSGKLTHYCGIRIYSHIIKECLENNFNITANKTKTILPPKNIPINLVKHFIRGSFDGDGSISWHKHNNKPRIQFASSSFSFISWIKETIEANLDVGNPQILQNKVWGTYLLDYVGFQVTTIMDWLYDCSTVNCRLNRKYDRYIDYKSKLHKLIQKKQQRTKHIRKRNKKIVSLRASGLTLKQISNELKVSEATCCNVIKNMEQNGPVS